MNNFSEHFVSVAPFQIVTTDEADEYVLGDPDDEFDPLALPKEEKKDFDDLALIKSDDTENDKTIKNYLQSESEDKGGLINLQAIVNKEEPCWADDDALESELEKFSHSDSQNTTLSVKEDRKPKILLTNLVSLHNLEDKNVAVNIKKEKDAEDHTGTVIIDDESNYTNNRIKQEIGLIVNDSDEDIPSTVPSVNAASSRSSTQVPYNIVASLMRNTSPPLNDNKSTLPSKSAPLVDVASTEPRSSPADIHQKTNAVAKAPCSLVLDIAEEDVSDDDDDYDRDESLSPTWSENRTSPQPSSSSLDVNPSSPPSTMQATKVPQHYHLRSSSKMIHHNTANKSRIGKGQPRSKDKPTAKTIMENNIWLSIVKKLKPMAPKTANTFENTVPLSNNEQNVQSTPKTQTNGSFNPNSNVFMLDGAHSSLPTQNIVPIILSPSFTQYSIPQFSVPQNFVMDSSNKSVNPVVNTPAMLHNPNLSDLTSIPNLPTTTLNIKQNTNDKVVELLPEDPNSSCLNNKDNTFFRNINTCDTVLDSTGTLSSQIIPENQRDLTIKENQSKLPESSKTSEAKVPKFVTIAPRPDQQVELRPSSTKTSGESRNEQNKVFRCRVCFTTYRDRLLMIKHVNQNHVNVTCKKCNRSFENRILLNRHKEEHMPSKYKCEICSDVFKYLRQLKHHRSREHPSPTKTGEESRNEQNKLFTCSLCFTTYHDRVLMNKHVSLNHVKVTCKKCNRPFENKILLRRHEEEHRSSKYKCEICPEAFKYMRQLKLHLSTVHLIEKRKTFVCNICGKTIKYLQSQIIEWHLLTHSDVRAFLCEICGKRFRTPGNLNFHKRVHNMQRPFSCTVCEKSYKQKYDLKEHMRVHSKVSEEEKEKC